VAESEKALVTRLAGRGTEDCAELLTRVQTAKHELARASEFDYGASVLVLRALLCCCCPHPLSHAPQENKPHEAAHAA
jgi:hypothetical protein